MDDETTVPAVEGEEVEAPMEAPEVVTPDAESEDAAPVVAPEEEEAA